LIKHKIYEMDNIPIDHQVLRFNSNDKK
jgi:hypothetical protein